MQPGVRLWGCIYGNNCTGGQSLSCCPRGPTGLLALAVPPRGTPRRLYIESADLPVTCLQLFTQFPRIKDRPRHSCNISERFSENKGERHPKAVVTDYV